MGNSINTLEINAVSCIRQDRLLFKDLSFTAHLGQLVRVYGKNGSGKSSLLKIISGLLRPSQGSVTFNQQNIHSEPALYRKHLTYIGHHSAVKPQLTVKENISYLANLRGTPISLTQLSTVLFKLELTDYQDIQAAYLSAGQQRRIALSRLWLEQTQLWILDEPYTALDTSMIDLLTSRLKQALSNSVTIILTSHQEIKDLEFPLTQIRLGE